MAELNNPQGVITDVNLNVYIADSSNGRIRAVCVTCGTNSPLDKLLAKLGVASPVNGYIYTIAGSGSTSTNTITAPTLATSVSMSPQKLALDNSGNLYISDGNGVIWFLEFHTGYLRAIARSATACSSKTDSYGDGCPATQASFGSNGNGLGVGADTQGNVYISDTLNGLIRKVSTGLQSSSTATTLSSARPVQVHFTAGDTLAGSNGLISSSSEWGLGTPSCTTNADTTTDCLLTSTFTPAIPGLRNSPLTVTSSLGNLSYLGLTGIGVGAGSTLDPASQTTFGTNLSVGGLATDNAGNLYVSDTTSKNLYRFSASAQTLGSNATGTKLATLTAPGAVAVDPRGYVYVADTSTGLITQVSSTGTVSTLPFSFTTPAGLAVDALNNLYISDSSALTVTQINPITGVERVLPVGTLITPMGLTIDPSGNLLIADPGAPALYRYTAQSGATTVSTTAAAPSAVVTDAAGNLLIADTSDILAVPSSTNLTVPVTGTKSSLPFTVASIAPAALAIDGAGNLYTGSGGGILKLNRTQGAIQFTAANAPLTASMLESGNQALTLTSVGQTDAIDYNLAATASTDCTVASGAPTALALGGVCTLTASYTPTTYLNTSDTATLNGNLVNAALSTPSAVQLQLSESVAPPADSIVLGSFSPSLPVYGQNVTVSATVTGSTVIPTGSVVFTVDTSTTTASLINGVATTILTGLSAGTHGVSAAYISSNGYASATSSVTSLIVATAAQTITFSAPSSPVAYGVSPITLSATGGASGNAIVYSLVSGPGTVSGNMLTITGVGTVVVAANQAGNTNYAAATQATQTVVVNQASQAITFPSLAATVTYGVGPITLGATSNSGLAVAYTVTGPATLNGNSLLINGVGAVNVTAVQAGNGNYTAATPVSQSFTVAPAVLTVTANNQSMTTGSPVPALTASYNGFVNGDSSSALSGSPSLATSVTTSSAAGIYPITITRGTLSASNYTFSFVNGSIAVSVAATPTLSTSATLTLVNGIYKATVTISNSGKGAASNVQLNTATLGSAVATTALPLNLGTIAAGSSTTVSISFPASAGSPGAASTDKFAGTYAGGSFSSGSRVTLP